MPLDGSNSVSGKEELFKPVQRGKSLESLVCIYIVYKRPEGRSWMSKLPSSASDPTFRQCQGSLIPAGFSE